jgi:alcohol dehydrogenase class IV
MPDRVTAITGVDALVHGIEAYVAKGSQPYSQSLALRAVGMVCDALPRVLKHPDDLEERGKMLVASNLAGMAFALSYLGLAHAMANPLTRVTGMAHGMAVGMVVPYVIRFNEPMAQKEYATMANQILGRQSSLDPREATLQLA